MSGQTIAEHLAAASPRDQLIAQFSKALSEVGHPAGATPSDVIAALVTNLCAVVRASAPPSAWRDVGYQIGERIKQRLIEGRG
jgi:hypothetical protein